jgi:hypothetical protein
MAPMNTHSVSVTSSNFCYASPRRCALTSCTNTQGMLPEWRIAISGEFASQDNQSRHAVRRDGCLRIAAV